MQNAITAIVLGGIAVVFVFLLAFAIALDHFAI